MFPLCIIHKYVSSSPEGKMHNQIDHFSRVRVWHSCTLYIRYFRGADCDTNGYLVVANARKGFAVRKRASQEIDVEKLSEEEFKGYQVTNTKNSSSGKFTK
jgi:hypothetical protein